MVTVNDSYGLPLAFLIKHVHVNVALYMSSDIKDDAAKGLALSGLYGL